MKNRIVYYLLFILLPCTVSAMDKVTLQLKWVHQAQFAGFYAALEHGYYRSENLKVTLVEGGRGVNPSEALVQNKADFAVLAPENILLKRSHNKAIKAICAIYRTSAVVFLSQKGSGIIRPQDFAGKTIAVEGSKGIRDFEFQLKALMKNMDVSMDDMTFVPYDTSYKGFIAGDIDITPAYLTGGYIKLKAQNIPMNVIYPGDYRVRFYSDVLATTDRMIESNPGLSLRFLRASLKGWIYALENIEKATTNVLKHARIKDRQLQLSMLEAAVPLVHTGDRHIGWMEKSRWQGMHNILLEQGILSKPLNSIDDVFSMALLKKVYDDN